MNKKITFIFIISILFVSALNAQRFNGGLLIGITASHTTGTLEDSVSFDSPAMFSRAFSKPGITGGVFTNLFLTDHSSIDLAVSYILKGSRKVPFKGDTIPGQVYESRLNLHYLTIPIHYRYNMNNYWSVFIGPNIGFLLGHKFTQNYMDMSDLYKFRLIDFAIDIGMGVAIFRNLYLDFNYSSTFFLTPIRSYNNKLSWKFGPFSKQFWEKGQCNRLFAFTLRWIIWGKEGDDAIFGNY